MLEIVIFPQLVAAIGNDCRVLTRKKGGQRSQRLAYEFIDTKRTSVSESWSVPLVEKQSKIREPHILLQIPDSRPQPHIFLAFDCSSVDDADRCTGCIETICLFYYQFLEIEEYTKDRKR